MRDDVAVVPAVGGRAEVHCAPAWWFSPLERAFGSASAEPVAWRFNATIACAPPIHEPVYGHQRIIWARTPSPSSCTVVCRTSMGRLPLSVPAGSRHACCGPANYRGLYSQPPLGNTRRKPARLSAGTGARCSRHSGGCHLDGLTPVQTGHIEYTCSETSRTGVRTGRGPFLDTEAQRFAHLTRSHQRPSRALHLHWRQTAGRTAILHSCTSQEGFQGMRGSGSWRSNPPRFDKLTVPDGAADRRSGGAHVRV